MSDWTSEYLTLLEDCEKREERLSDWERCSDGATKCMAFVPLGHSVPPPRCEHTLGLFADCEPPNVGIER